MLKPFTIARGAGGQREWAVEVLALCLSLTGSLFLLLGGSGPSPAGLPGHAYVGTVEANETLAPYIYLGLLSAAVGFFCGLFVRRSLAGKWSMTLPLLACAWILLHNGRV